MNWRDGGNCPLCPCKMVDIGEIYRERTISLCTGECLLGSGEAVTQLAVNEPTAGSNPAFPATFSPPERQK